MNGGLYASCSRSWCTKLDRGWKDCVAKSERRRLRAQLQYRHFFATSFRRGACFRPATYAPHSMRHRFSFEWGAKSFFVAKTEGAIVTNVGVFLRLPTLKYASSTSLFCNLCTCAQGAKRHLPKFSKVEGSCSSRVALVKLLKEALSKVCVHTFCKTFDFMTHKL
jgi:hypothetical protein